MARVWLLGASTLFVSSIILTACSDSSSTDAGVADAGISETGTITIDAAADATIDAANDAALTDSSSDANHVDAATGPSAACTAVTTAFTACGNTLPVGDYKVSTLCSAPASSSRSPSCSTPSTGSTTVWAEGSFGVGQLQVGSGSLAFSGVVPATHYVSDGPKSCVLLNDCNRAVTGFYGFAPSGTCAESPAGSCHCEWNARVDTTGSGSSSYTSNGTSITWFGKTIPYCVTGTSIAMDLSNVYPDVGKPLVVTFVKQ